MSEDAVPLPRAGEVFFDVRGEARSMRLSWYADSQIAVFSIWQAGRCTGTFRLPFADLDRMIETLRRGPDPEPASGGAESAGRPLRGLTRSEPRGYDQPGNDQPGYDQPRYEQPGYAVPGNEAPGYDAPGYDGPARMYQTADYAPPWPLEPVRSGAGTGPHDQPGYDQPGFAPPGYQERGYEQSELPGYELPGYQPPGYEVLGLPQPGPGGPGHGEYPAAQPGPGYREYPAAQPGPGGPGYSEYPAAQPGPGYGEYPAGRPGQGDPGRPDNWQAGPGPQDWTWNAAEQEREGEFPSAPARNSPASGYRGPA